MKVHGIHEATPALCVDMILDEKMMRSQTSPCSEGHSEHHTSGECSTALVAMELHYHALS